MPCLAQSDARYPYLAVQSSNNRSWDASPSPSWEESSHRGKCFPSEIATHSQLLRLNNTRRTLLGTVLATCWHALVSACPNNCTCARPHHKRPHHKALNCAIVNAAANSPSLAYKALTLRGSVPMGLDSYTHVQMDEGEIE